MGDPQRTRKINAVERQKRGNAWWRHRSLSRTGRMSWGNWFIERTKGATS